MNILLSFNGIYENNKRKGTIMSDLLENADKRKGLLKELIQKLHTGETPTEAKNQLIHLMGEIPYEDVVAVEQELISDGMSQDQILHLCDLHSVSLKQAAEGDKKVSSPPGHPVDTFQKENRAIEHEIDLLKSNFHVMKETSSEDELKDIFKRMKMHFIALTDIDKHYRRKEELLFPFLEKHGITGPSKVMWAKQDETRATIKKALEQFKNLTDISTQTINDLYNSYITPAIDALIDLIGKEENILFPMSLENLTESEWYQVYNQSIEVGFCLYDPTDEWQPDNVSEEDVSIQSNGRINLPSGSLTVPELTALLNAIPFDMTFVDKDDTVRYFTQGRERIFARSRAILGRKVQLCHPPSSVDTVERILEDFKSGKEENAAFWIELQGKFIHIEYFALRGDNGEYLGTLEVSQNLTEKRALTGERRLLTYEKK